MLSPQKVAELRARMAALGIREEDLAEKFIRASGPGGQKVNKTSSAVYLLHKPSGLDVKCARDRSQAINRLLARRLLCERLEARLRAAASAKQQEIEKQRRRKRQKSRRQKLRMIADKRLRAALKSARRAPEIE
jgi:protein subunit release factor B